MTSLGIITNINLILYLTYILLWIKTYNLRIYNITIPSKSTWLYYSLIFCTIAGWGLDYVHYYQAFIRFHTDPISIIKTHMEIIYPIIALQLSDNQYLIYRLIIWGSSLYITSLILTELNINNNFTGAIFILSTLIWFSCSRASLGYSIFTYGYILFIKNRKRNSYKIIIGIIISIASIFLHKSCIILVLLILPSLLDTRKILYTTLLVLPFVIVLTKSYFSIINIDLLNDVSNIGNAYNDYTDNIKGNNMSTVGLIIYTTEKVAFVYTLYIALKYMKSLKQPTFKYLTNLTLLLFFLYIITTISGIGGVLADRISLISYYTIFFCAAIIFNNKFSRKPYLTYSALYYSSGILQLLYSCYLNNYFFNTNLHLL